MGINRIDVFLSLLLKQSTEGAVLSSRGSPFQCITALYAKFRSAHCVRHFGTTALNSSFDLNSLSCTCRVNMLFNASGLKIGETFICKFAGWFHHHYFHVIDIQFNIQEVCRIIAIYTFHCSKRTVLLDLKFLKIRRSSAFCEETTVGQMRLN